MPSASPHVVDVTEATFQPEVAEASMRTPVLIDFWATWCGPCKTLGPMLEELADSYGGAFRLAKVDVDESPSLAQYFRAQSIPMVLAIFQGAVVDQFVGALPKPKLRQFVDSVLGRCGVAVPVLGAEVPTDPAAAEAHWRARVAKSPEDGKALLELGRLLLTRGEDGEATEVLGRIQGQMPEFAAAQAALALKGLLAEVEAAGGADALRARLDADPEDAEARLLAACAVAVRGRFAESLEVLVGLVGSERGELRDRAKSAATTVLSAAGRGDEGVEAARRRLARLLF